MQARDRARHLDQAYQQRRGHNQHLSISDDNYHVTEAIGDMYDDDEPSPASPEYLRQNRPLSFMPSPLGDTINPSNRFGNGGRSPPRAHMQRQGSGERVPGINGMNGDPRRVAVDGLEGQRLNASPNGSPPPMLNRQPSDTANQPFEMSLDYSKPEDVAQELSNLQAIRRMSMDVNSQDPDLPSFNPSFRVPAVAPPTHGADEGDPSRLFWVPARLHPELAPKEFKTFIEDKVKTIKRTSAGEESLLSPDGLSRQGSAGGSLRRKKSMLSRQIDSGNNYQDGAERLERQRSVSDRPEGGVGLKELETLVTDPSSLTRKISEEVHRESLDSGVDLSPANDDMPLFPGQGGPTLKRSTRTQYRRGSIRKGEKLPFSKRLAARQAGGGTSETDDSPASSPNTDVPPIPQLPLMRVQTEPTSSNLAPTIENFDFSRPGRKRAPVPATPGFLGELDFGESAGGENDFFQEQPREQQMPPPQDEQPNGHRSFHSRIASNPRTTAASIGAVPVPQIVETPPPDPSYPQSMQHPERKSSRSPTSSEPPPSQPPQQPLPNRPRMQPPQQQQQQPPRPGMQRHAQQQSPSQTFDEMTSHHSSMAGGSTRTDTLSIIPTMPDERKIEKKKSKEDSRKTSWGWLGSRGKDERDERERKEEEASRRAKAKSPRPGDESSSGRLDVLQQQIDGNVKPRESLVLDRNSIHLEEARKKESNRKSGESAKKEKDGIFSSLFSSKKKDKDGTGKSSKQRGLSPEPPPRIMKPDVDYNWTRFSIMEERAIYRMAHIKLANPRRELYSQVLLSNFMYSYLAKVQSQHPQLQMATGPGKQRPSAKKEQQQQQQQQQRQQPSNQPEEYSQYQRYQQQQQDQHHQQGQQDPSQHHQGSHSAAEQAEDGPMEPRSDSRVSQHTQYSMHHDKQQQAQHQSYGSSHDGYGGGYGGHGGGHSGHSGAPSNQGGPVNYIGGHANQRSEPLTNDQGDMW